MLLTQTLKLENRKRLRRFDRLTEQVGHLLCNGTPFPFRSCLKLLVEGVGQVLDVQRSHHSSTIPPFWIPRRFQVKAAATWRRRESPGGELDLVLFSVSRLA